MAAWTDALPAGPVRFGRRLTTIRESAQRDALDFADGSSETVDVVIGAGGIHSRVRTAKIQIGSLGNQWMKTQGNADWVHWYDALRAPLDAA